MTRATIAGGVFATLLVVVALATGYWGFGADDPAVAFTRFLHDNLERDADPAAATPPPEDLAAAGIHEGLIYGRIITTDGSIYEGRLRWGGDEEAVKHADVITFDLRGSGAPSPLPASSSSASASARIWPSPC